MEMMQLEMFVRIVEECSFVKAAARVFRTQPAVSQALKRLEEEIGHSLFNRTHKRDLRLTQAGETLFEFASRILALKYEALSALGKEVVDDGGRICVGISEGINPNLFPKMMKVFHGRHPKFACRWYAINHASSSVNS